MKTGAELFVKCLEAQGVKYIFGVPGAKIDGIYSALVDSKQIKLIHCRHEQNAAFTAAARGRLIGNPGVVLITSGSGVGNLTAGLLTATTEGDPVVAIGGNIAKNMRSKNAHQNADNVKILEPVTKHACEILTVENIPEMIANAFQIATNRRKGATFISVPQDIQFETKDVEILPPHHDIHATLANQDDIKLCAEMINQAHMPILLLGEDASEAASTRAIRDLLTQHSLPVVSTYQGAGVVSKELVNRFGGALGCLKLNLVVI